MAKKSPWLADAAKGATMREYPIRTIEDFLTVPEDRRYVCLREFHSWLYMRTATADLLIACGAPPDSIRPKNPGLFVWKDDGKSTITITLHEAPESVGAVDPQEGCTSGGPRAKKNTPSGSAGPLR